MGVAYTEAINLLNYSACVIPVTRADKSIDKIDESYQPLGPMDEKNYEACGLRLSIMQSRILADSARVN